MFLYITQIHNQFRHTFKHLMHTTSYLLTLRVINIRIYFSPIILFY